MFTNTGKTTTFIDLLNAMGTKPVAPPPDNVIVEPHLFMQVTATAIIKYRQSTEEGLYTSYLVRYTSNQGNESLWAMTGQAPQHTFAGMRTSLTVCIEDGRLIPERAICFGHKPTRPIDLLPVPETFFGYLPSGVVAEIQENLAGDFAGDGS